MASFSADWQIEYDENENKMKHRTIGIEFEGSMQRTNCPEPMESEYDDEYDEEYDELSYEFERWIKEHYDLSIPGVGRDGSEYEFVTEPDSINLYNKGGSERFKNFMNFLKENVQPTAMDGTHIHISHLPGEDTEEMFQRIKLIMAVFGLQAQKIFGRMSTWAFTPAQIIYDRTYGAIRTRELEKIIIPKDEAEIRRIGLDCKGSIVVQRHKTYEFRGPKGSNDIKEVLAWVQFVNNILKMAERKNFRDIKFKNLLKGKYIREYYRSLSSNPMRSFSQDEIEQTINSNKYIQFTTHQVGATSNIL